MQIDYTPFINRVIERYEGNYGWDRNDPGGPTRYGITCFDLAAFMGKPMTSMAAWAPIVQAMPLATAEEIYATKYATACDFNNLGPGKDCVVCDWGINSGPSTAIRYAQRLVGAPVDGDLGDTTEKAINDYDPEKFIVGLCAARMAFLRSLGTWSTFGTGWTARVTDLQSYSLGLLAQKPVGLVDFVEDGYVDKLTLVHPTAFAKAYDADFINALVASSNTQEA